MGSDIPRVSIGLPVYNGEKYIREALDSILAQTFDDFELIISDNASTDKTKEICETYAAKDKRIRYHRNEVNLGAARNFNRAFELSSGEYFKWVAADEALEPEFLECCFEALENDPTFVLFGTQYKQYDEFKKTLSNRELNHDFSSPDICERFTQLFLRALGPNQPIWGLIRSRELRETHLIGSFIGSDDCLLIELIMKGKFGQVSKFLYRLRTHPDAYHSMASTRNGKEDSKQAKWFDTQNKGNIFLPHWRRLWEFSLIVIRSNAALNEKVTMLMFLIKVGFWRRGILTKEIVYAFRQVMSLW